MGPSPGHCVLPKPPPHFHRVNSTPLPVYPRVSAPGGPGPSSAPPWGLDPGVSVGHRLPPPAISHYLERPPAVPAPPPRLVFQLLREQPREQSPEPWRERRYQDPGRPETGAPAPSTPPPPSRCRHTFPSPRSGPSPPLQRSFCSLALCFRTGGVKIVGCQHPGFVSFLPVPTSESGRRKEPEC